MNSKTDTVIIIFGVLLTALLLAGLVGVIAYTGTKGAQREQAQVLTCLNQGGTWVNQWEACIYGKDVTPQ